MTDRPTPDWRSVAEDLARALGSFTAYDGYGQGGADDANRGNWDGAYFALSRYRRAADEVLS